MSGNFDFLSDYAPELQKLGSLAEKYAYSDPESALVKLRTYAEQLVKSIYLKKKYTREGTMLMDLLVGRDFKAATPNVVQTKFHAIRKEGNKAAHGSEVSSKTVTWLINEAHELGRWYSVYFCKASKEDLPLFKAISPTEETAKTNEKLEGDLETLIETLEAEKAKYKEVEQELETLKAESDKAQVTADALNMNEEETRKRLIDISLAKVGWKVDKDGKSNDEVGQEIEITHTVESLGQGFVDYVLWDDNGKPLAVVEAKRTSKSAEIGRKQAELYASALEAETGQRPVIFYTNGYDIFIWDDTQGYPPRKIYDFYSKDSLQYLVNFQRKEKVPLDTLSPNPEIAGRTYQFEAIKRVTEKFEGKHRKALLVMATGTGKTRVAVALTDLLMRAKWVKRVLFLCDRKVLRTQAKDAFTDHTDYSVTIGGKKPAKDETARIRVATYPGMMSKFEEYDPGYFDLIIADESHRSIYNMYKDLFTYFDCFQVGLTATPIGFINKSTYQMFECDPENPTAFYDLERAIEEEYLVPYDVQTYTTKFIRDGIKYSELTDKQKTDLEEDGELPEDINFDSNKINKDVLNKDTNRHIIRNLMDNGITDENNQNIGKSIIFARNHDHAILMSELFDEMYPDYGGKFCQVIDSHDSRAEQLIKDFKGLGDNDQLTIAISVDMLDTGIDVPEVVNLVFAKPVKSKVKFWQMIGRGTRLCPNLFGDGNDKKQFSIFDHWNNFEYFEQDKPEARPTAIKSLRQRLFEMRMALASVTMELNRKSDFKIYINLIDGDVKSLPDKSISVKEKWKAIQSVLPDGIIEEFAPSTVVTLETEIAPLMKWIDTRGHGMSYNFDLLVTYAEYTLIKGAGEFGDFKDKIINLVANLQTILPQVRTQIGMINKVKSQEYWEDVTLADLENMRKALRGIIKYQHDTGGPKRGPKTIDIAEDGSLVHKAWRSSNIKSIDMKVYRLLVESALVALFEEDQTLQKIRQGIPVTEHELTELSSLVLTRNPGVKLELLEEFFPELAGHLDLVIRSIVGMEKTAVKEQFTTFVQTHPKLSPNQIRFLDMLQSQIAQNGQIKLEQLITEAPFTSIHPEGIDGVFDDNEADEIITIAKQFEFPIKEGNTP